MVAFLRGGPVRALVAAPSGHLVAATDETLKIWDVGTQQLVAEAEGHRQRVLCLAVVGAHIYSGGEDKTVKAWSM